MEGIMFGQSVDSEGPRCKKLDACLIKLYKRKTVIVSNAANNAVVVMILVIPFYNTHKKQENAPKITMGKKN